MHKIVRFPWPRGKHQARREIFNDLMQGIDKYLHARHPDVRKTATMEVIPGAPVLHVSKLDSGGSTTAAYELVSVVEPYS